MRISIKLTNQIRPFFQINIKDNYYKKAIKKWLYSIIYYISKYRLLVWTMVSLVQCWNRKYNCRFRIYPNPNEWSIFRDMTCALAQLYPNIYTNWRDLLCSHSKSIFDRPFASLTKHPCLFDNKFRYDNPRKKRIEILRFLKVL